MNAIVCNTLTGAVSEYARYPFQSITPTHGGSATGLYAFGGDKDVDLPIVSDIRLPSTLRESTLKHSIQTIYLSMIGAGMARLTVHGAKQSWSYLFPMLPSGQTRCQIGRGIRENYLGFSLSNPAGQAFSLDRMEVLTGVSPNRRVF